MKAFLKIWNNFTFMILWGRYVWLFLLLTIWHLWCKGQKEFISTLHPSGHIRRMYTEEVAKVVAYRIASIPCRPSYIFCTSTIWKIGWIASYSSIRPGAKKPVFKSSWCKELKQFCPSKKQRRPLPSFLYKSVLLYIVVGWLSLHK